MDGERAAGRDTVERIDDVIDQVALAVFFATSGPDWRTCYAIAQTAVLARLLS